MICDRVCLLEFSIFRYATAQNRWLIERREIILIAIIIKLRRGKYVYISITRAELNCQHVRTLNGKK